MSLESSRGRFSNKKISRADFTKIQQKSELSKVGVKPLESITSKARFEVDKQKEISQSPSKTNEQKYTKRELYNKKQSELANKHVEKPHRNKYEFDEQFDFTDNNKKKIDIKTIVAMAVVELLTIVVILFAGRLVRMSRMTQQVSFNKKEVKNTNIDSVTVEKMKGYLTVALFGLDNRNESVASGNADVNKIVHLNLETGELKIISVYRDLFLSITNGNSYGKLNAAYARGGPENSVKVLNKNLDLDISSYFSFNWKAVADVIDLLGGVDVEVTKSEMKYFNAFIHETCVSTGIAAKNPAVFYVKSSGLQHLYGVQAVAYARLRLTDNDIKRTERQNTIMSLCLEKAKQLEPSKLVYIAEYILPQISYEFDMSKAMSLASTVKGISLSESYGFPTLQNLKMMDMGANGSCLVPNSLESAVKKLHQYMYATEDYTPSSAVRSYSNRILELSREYEAENKAKTEKKSSDSDKEADESDETKSSSNKNTNNNSNSSKKSSSNESESSKETKSTNTSTSNEEQAVVLDQAPYEDEPESDNNSQNTTTNTNIPNSNNANNTNTTNATTNPTNNSVPMRENIPTSPRNGPVVAPGQSPDSINSSPVTTAPINGSPVAVPQSNTGGPRMNENTIIVPGPIS